MIANLQKVFLFIFIFLFCGVLYAQSQWNIKVGMSGELDLYALLDSLGNKINIAYSRDKIPNQRIVIKKSANIKSILQQLETSRIAHYNLTHGQVILAPYEKKSYSISGILKDMDSGEDIIGATAQIVGTNNGTVTNGYGHFSITLFEGIYTISFSHIGYKSHTIEVDLSKNVNLSIGLSSNATTLKTIEVNAISSDENIVEPIPSINRIFISQTDSEIPYLLAEVDVIQNALLQPGIKSIGEDASGIHVRGGGVDQNLTLLDEAPIYNPNHFFGLISAFNPEAVNDVRILKGFIPPSYGGRGSSVIEVRQKEGNTTKIRYSGGIGLVSARGLIEGPIQKGKSSFLISGRQSLLNLSINDFASTSVRRNRNRFQDLNLKLNTRPNENNKFYLSGYYGLDRNRVGLNSIRRWGNRILNARWNHIFSPQLFSNIVAFISEYDYRIEKDEEPGAFIGRSKIRDIGLKTDFAYTFETSNEVTFGLNTIYHRLSPGSQEPLAPEASTNIVELETERGLESALYASHEFSIGKAYIMYGLRYSMLHTFGPAKNYLYANNIPTSDIAIIDTVHFSSGELINSFKNMEPRAAISYVLNPNTSIKTSYTKNTQYIHLISNTISPAPTDMWKLSDNFISPLITNQYTIGLYKNMLKNNWETSIEGYFKEIKNNIQYKNGADLIFNENIETELLFGNARAYGLEFLLKKKRGKLKGWIAYTLSRAESILETEYIPENHDKKHDLSSSWTYTFSNRISASANFVYNTGIPVTLPTDKYVFEGNIVPHFTQRNNSRLPDYHRLDLSLRINGKKIKKDGSVRKNQNYWIISIYNVYARKNAYSYFFRESDLNPSVGEIVQYSIFGTAIPGITYNFKF